MDPHTLKMAAEYLTSRERLLISIADVKLPSSYISVRLDDRTLSISRDTMLAIKPIVLDELEAQLKEVERKLRGWGITI